jgi:hypothetical protein
METRTGYMCKTEFDYDLSNAKGGSKVFSSVEDLRQCCRCVEKECGIVEVEVKVIRVIQESRI